MTGRSVALAAILAIALPAFGPAGATAQGDDPRLPSVALPPAADSVLRAYETAWAAGDGAALAALFTEDGVIRRGSWIRGRVAIRERYDAVAGGDLRLRAVDSRIGETTGWIVGAYGYGDAAAERDAGVFVLALERADDGRWLIASDLDHPIGG